jgi:rhamnose utilization protein RhaD (predicted bifunctional aldolase and dehydrogenase)
MKEEQSYERLLRVLHDMQAQIAERVRPVAQQVVQAEVERLQNLSIQKRSILNDCLALIDQTILDCRSQMEEYRQTRSALSAVNESLADLGAEPMAVPDHFPTESLGDLILARVEGLRAEGKI